MKFDNLAKFRQDMNGLPIEHQRMFLGLMREFNAACEAYAVDRGTIWPAKFRVKQMVGVKGVWEMTWSYSSPDGRATFEFTQIDGETGVLWRRIGRHEIYKEP